MNQDRLILASASPRRRELLARIYAAFDVDPCPYPEPPRKSGKTEPRMWAESLAYFKARAVADRHPKSWILAADTLVVCRDEILGKPRDLDDARRMLELQADRAGDVVTGVCLVRREAGRERLTQCSVTRVWMRDDPAAREAYLQSGDWQGKAGAYGIQDAGDRLVARIDGSFSNVVGLPLELVAQMLQSVGLPAGTPPPERWEPANRT